LLSVDSINVAVKDPAQSERRKLRRAMPAPTAIVAVKVYALYSQALSQASVVNGPDFLSSLNNNLSNLSSHITVINVYRTATVPYEYQDSRRYQTTFTFAMGYNEADFNARKDDVETRIAVVCGVDRADVSTSVVAIGTQSRRRLQESIEIEAVVMTTGGAETETVSTKIYGDDFASQFNEEFNDGFMFDVGSSYTVNRGEISEAVPNANTASSHGDPIIWTFKGECYDLNKDGLYLASSHPEFSHDVYVAVYNEFIREIQIQDEDNTILLSISNLNELSGEWNYGFKQRDRICRTMSWKECEFSHPQYAFDAQVLRYTVQIMHHDYLDPALKDGQRGVHLDIYPKVYEKRLDQFVPEEFDGIYFDNPYPEELHYCPADSPKRA